MNLQSINASVSPEVQMNDNFETLDFAAVYGKRQPVTTGLTWGYYGGIWNGFTITAATLTLTNAATNYVVVARSTGVISVSTATTNWNNTTDYARVYKITTAGGVVTTVEDHRAGLHGVHGPHVGLPQNSQSTNYEAVATDAGKHLLHPAADNNPRTFTIPANASVAYPIGTTLTFINEINVLTIAITSDTLVLAGSGATGSRTLNASGMATAIKITATKWMISGNDLT